MGEEEESVQVIPSAFTSLAAGAISGLTVDLALFPLDAFKTRIQSEKGFWKAGGFKNIYKGIGPTAAGSAPCSAVFFVVYNESKGCLNHFFTGNWSAINHVVSACTGELVANIVRVPLDILKQRQQTTHHLSVMSIIRHALHYEGPMGLYRGFNSTVMRDIPFSVIQFPIWEALKTYVRRKTGRDTTPVDSAVCGAVAGSLAGAVTTPLDLARTRIMLAEYSATAPIQSRMWPVLRQIYSTQGIQGLFRGIVPRTIFIFIGGGVYFGCYEAAKDFIEHGYIIAG